MKLGLVITAAVFLAGLSPAQAQTSEFTSEQRVEGEAMVLKSAQDVHLYKTLGRDNKEHVGLCGEVNAKNGYGGMSGWHSFMLVGDKVYVGGAGEIINADEICNNGRGISDTRDYLPELRAEFDKQLGG